MFGWPNCFGSAARKHMMVGTCGMVDQNHLPHQPRRKRERMNGKRSKIPLRSPWGPPTRSHLPKVLQTPNSTTLRTKPLSTWALGSPNIQAIAGSLARKEEKYMAVLIWHIGDMNACQNFSLSRFLNRKDRFQFFVWSHHFASPY
jgi:hypothetical protein